MQITKVKMLLLVVVVLVGIVSWQGYKSWRLKQQLTNATATITATALEAAGWKKATELKESALTALQQSLAASRRSASTDVVRVAARTPEGTVSIRVQPTSDAVASPEVIGMVPAATLPPLPASLQSLDIAISNSLELAVDVTPKRELFYVGSITTNLRTQHDQATVTLPIETAAVELGGELQKALRYYDSRPSRFAIAPRSLKHWRLGWTAGAGIVDPLNDPQLGAFIGFGVQF